MAISIRSNFHCPCISHKAPVRVEISIEVRSPKQERRHHPARAEISMLLCLITCFVTFFF